MLQAWSNFSGVILTLKILSKVFLSSQMKLNSLKSSNPKIESTYWRWNKPSKDVSTGSKRMKLNRTMNLLRKFTTLWTALPLQVMRKKMVQHLLLSLLALLRVAIQLNRTCLPKCCLIKWNSNKNSMAVRHNLTSLNFNKLRHKTQCLNWLRIILM